MRMLICTTSTSSRFVIDLHAQNKGTGRQSKSAENWLALFIWINHVSQSKGRKKNHDIDAIKFSSTGHSSHRLTRLISSRVDLGQKERLIRKSWSHSRTNFDASEHMLNTIEWACCTSQVQSSPVQGVDHEPIEVSTCPVLKAWID